MKRFGKRTWFSSPWSARRSWPRWAAMRTSPPPGHRLGHGRHRLGRHAPRHDGWPPLSGRPVADRQLHSRQPVERTPVGRDDPSRERRYGRSGLLRRGLHDAGRPRGPERGTGQRHRRHGDRPAVDRRQRQSGRVQERVPDAEPEQQLAHLLDGGAGCGSPLHLARPSAEPNHMSRKRKSRARRIAVLALILLSLLASGWPCSTMRVGLRRRARARLHRLHRPPSRALRGRRRGRQRLRRPPLRRGRARAPQAPPRSRSTRFHR